MIEPTLAYLGKFLSDRFEVDKKKVVYVDKDSVFRKLSTQDLPLTLPTITYFNTNVALLGMQVGRRRGALLLDGNLARTVSTTLELQPVTMEITVGLVSSNLKDHFNLIKSYISLLQNSTFSVDFKIGTQSQLVDLSITELMELSTPPEGKEGYDFDRGVFYTLEGGFRVGSFVLFTKDFKLVREIDYSLYLDDEGNDLYINRLTA